MEAKNQSVDDRITRVDDPGDALVEQIQAFSTAHIILTPALVTFFLQHGKLGHTAMAVWLRLCTLAKQRGDTTIRVNVEYLKRGMPELSLEMAQKAKAFLVEHDLLSYEMQRDEKGRNTGTLICVKGIPSPAKLAGKTTTPETPHSGESDPILDQEAEEKQERKNIGRPMSADTPVAPKEAEKSTEATKAENQTGKVVKAYSPDFESMWAIYPLKKDKAMAFRQWSARLKAGARKEDILIAVRHYAAETRDTLPKFIKRAKTFIGCDGSWEEYIHGVPGERSARVERYCPHCARPVSVRDISDDSCPFCLKSLEAVNAA